MTSGPVLEKLTEISEVQGRMLASLESQQKLLASHAGQLTEQSKVLTRNTITVEEHHKRSTMLEDDHKLIRSRVAALEDKEENKKAVREFLESVVKWIGYCAIAVTSFAGLLMGAYELAKKLGL